MIDLDAEGYIVKTDAHDLGVRAQRDRERTA